MLRISLTYISLVIFLSLFFSFMTLKFPNYFNQFGNDEKLKIVLKESAAHFK